MGFIPSIRFPAKFLITNVYGRASVPFSFDVHAMVYSQNAPEFEGVFHKKLDTKRLNLVNQRREFFNVSLQEIEAIAKDLKREFNLTRVAEAKEYRESRSINAAKEKVEQTEELPDLKKFLVSL